MNKDLAELLSTRLFKALGDPTRAALLCCLADAGEPATVTEACGCCAVDFSVVSRHLATLRDAGVLEAERRGKQVFYRIRAKEVAERLRDLADALEASLGETR